MQLFTGRPRYVEQKIKRFLAQGYMVVYKHQHPDASITVKMTRLTA